VTVLALDASTARATVAALRSGAVVAAAEVAERSEHVEPLLPAALALLASASLSLADLTAIVCGAGPGGFTGLRTAASIAKGLAMGLSVPLHAVPSLPLIATDLPAGRYLAVLDAGRGDRFVALIDWPNAEGVGYRLVPATQVASIAAELGATVVGPETGQWPHVRGAAGLNWGDPVDLASWEPDYGRDSAAQDRRRAAAAP
jgi:tRNA threonylcarbamoyl adenosine modification protein YeaZ